MSARLEESPTVRLQAHFPEGPGEAARNQATQHYEPRHAASDPEPQHLVTPAPVVSAVGDTSTRLSVDQVQRAVRAPNPRPIGEETEVIRYSRIAGPPSKELLLPLAARHSSSTLKSEPTRARRLLDTVRKGLPGRGLWALPRKQDGR